jgi:hypothetical protein
VHRYLSDSSVDWGQQLYGVKHWVGAHPGEECWFAYVGRPYLNPKEYGIDCRPLPNLATAWLGEWTEVPPRIHGTVLVSADNLEGCEWPSRKLNPYDSLRNLPVAGEIQHGVLIFQGNIDTHLIAGLSAAQRAQILLARRLRPAISSRQRQPMRTRSGLQIRWSLPLVTGMFPICRRSFHAETRSEASDGG